MNSVSPPDLYWRTMDVIAEKARSAGCEVGLIERQWEGVAQGRYAHFLVVNGHCCALHHLESRYQTSRRSKRWVTSTELSRNVLEHVEAVIFHLTIPGYPNHLFVIPARILLTAYFTQGRVWRRGTKETKKPRISQRVFLPIEKHAVYHNRVPVIDYWKYEDAWNWVPKEESPSQT